MHIPAVIKPQMTDVGPPLGRARESEADSAVQELRMANASPSMASGEKLRLSSALWPRDARWRSSFSGAAMLCFLAMVVGVEGFAVRNARGGAVKGIVYDGCPFFLSNLYLIVGVVVARDRVGGSFELDVGGGLTARPVGALGRVGRWELGLGRGSSYD